MANKYRQAFELGRSILSILFNLFRIKFTIIKISISLIISLIGLRVHASIYKWYSPSPFQPLSLFFAIRNNSMYLSYFLQLLSVHTLEGYSKCSEFTLTVNMEMMNCGAKLGASPDAPTWGWGQSNWDKCSCRLGLGAVGFTSLAHLNICSTKKGLTPSKTNDCVNAINTL